MKIKTTCFFFLLCLSLFAQEKGGNPINHNSSIINHNSQTYAVVIGISDYQDDNIPDLRFANKDAEAFAAFLQSPSGGNLPAENLQILTDKSATTGAMASAFDWLLEECKADDEVIIYFSGHGDVETRTRFQRGFLLTYDSPPTNYLAGAFALIFLQDIISTLSENDVRVLMISDACRAGKLAGSEIGGAQATAANLSKQYANELKILSCQPDEFSLEGEQWGGGRGAFSYHLIDGLTGLADNNGDSKINLLEINRYLEETVPAETAPQSQIPMVVGSKGTVIANVDESSLLALRERKENETPSIAAIETKGFEEVMLAEIDSVWEEKYKQFTDALEKGELLEPTGLSAYDLYAELSEVEELARLHGLMKRNLATALQDESQQAINAFLRSDNEEMAAQYRGEAKYGKFVRYLEKAASLLGPKHYMHKTLKAKQHYFEGVDIAFGQAAKNYSLADSAAIWHDRTKAALQRSLDYEPNAAYTHVYMAAYVKGNEKHAHLRKALELAPQWAITYAVYGFHYLLYAERQDLKKADSLLNIAIRLNPNFSHSYQGLGLLYQQQNKLEKAEKMFKKAIALSPRDPQHLWELGSLYYYQKRYKEAEKIWLEVMELSPGEDRIYAYLSRMYLLELFEYKKAEAINLQRLEKRPTSGYGYNDLIFTYKFSGQLEKLRALVKKMEHLNNSIHKWDGELSLGYAYLFLKDYDTALRLANNHIKNAPNNRESFKFKGAVLVQKKEYDAAIPLIETAFDKGMAPWHIIDEIDFYELSKAVSFKAFAVRLMEKMPDNGFGYRMMSIYHQNQGDFEKAKNLYAKAVELSPDYENKRVGYVTRQIADCYRKVSQGNYEKALYFLNAALAAGNRDYDKIQYNTQLDPLRELPKFKELMRAYFPEKFND